MRKQFSAPLIVKDGGHVKQLERLELMSRDFDEDWLQSLLFHNPDLLPIQEIDRSFLNPIPVCRELNTPAGPVDILYVTPNGKLVLLEAKLWRNPEARRTVIGQILDYAKELSRWSYSDLQREVAARTKQTGNVLYDFAAADNEDISEQEFVDEVSRCLRRAEFLLLICGDGVREGAASIANFLEGSGTLHFTFGLVEMALFKIEVDEVLVQPRILAQTTIVNRTVVTVDDQRTNVEDGAAASDDSELSDDQRFNQAFWKLFVDRLKLDDANQKIPNVTTGSNVYFMFPSETSSWINVYKSKSKNQIGVFITGNRGPKHDVVLEMIRAETSEIQAELGTQLEWIDDGGGKYSVGIRQSVPNVMSTEGRDEMLEWLSDNTNKFVTAFRHRVIRALS